MKNEPDWIEWDNEEDSLCPVPNGNDVEVRFLDGQTSRDTNPEEWTWYNTPDHVTDSDIVAYRDWTAFKQNQQEKQMTGQQFKQQRNHPASALAEQIDQANNQSNEEHATVADLLDILTRDQQLFALGYLTAKLEKQTTK